MRCVVCGRRPSEQCNPKTHRAHYRQWQAALTGVYGAHRERAREILKTLDKANERSV